MSSEAVESITVRLAGLELTITARPISSGPSAVQDHSQRGIHRVSVCHAFPSQAEAEAYVAGAGEPWPQRREE